MLSVVMGLSMVADRQVNGTVEPSNKARQSGQASQCGGMGYWSGEKRLEHSDGWGDNGFKRGNKTDWGQTCWHG